MLGCLRHEIESFSSRLIAPCRMLLLASLNNVVINFQPFLVFFIILSVADDDRAKSDRFGGHFEGWSDEDVIRAYLLQQLRRSDPSITAVSDPAAKYMQRMKPMFLSSRELAGY